MLELADIEPYLRDRGLIGARAVVDGGLAVTDLSRRNRVYLAATDDSTAYLLKQPRYPGDPGVAREAAVLSALASSGLRQVAPSVLAFDSARDVLVVGTTPGARDLRRRFARRRFSKAVAAACGRALAKLHLLRPDVVGERREDLDPAWALSWHQPTVEGFHELSAVNIELLRRTQASKQVCDSLDELRGSWAAETLIHGDVRWDNWITDLSPNARGRSRVLLADWELAGPGDPRLDTGAFIGEYLLAWIESIPIANPRDPSRFVAHARVPLQRIQPSLIAFLRAYMKVSRGSGRRNSLLGSVRFAGLRLIQAAVEQARESPVLQARMLLSMQLAENLLAHPAETARLVMGLPVLDDP